MKKLGFLFILASLVLVPLNFSFAHEEDWDCKDIVGHPDRAEHYYNEHMPDDPDRLDADGDGIICDGTYLPPSKGGNDKEDDDHEGSGDDDHEGSHDSNNNQSNNTDSDQKQGGDLPKTATNYPSYSLIGALMIIAGAIALWFRRQLN